ncbi:hypothetical protein Glove_212g208 [Diversispora epigaea]|uniref:Protein kinase domain-containing protein n=1 Tax=Diversispora epigaea TaxID=1348612 RepID=A0A397IR50_9GLOM|nr:hypothetical protein Glove_212g208 [Diversispora epigaea]
MPKVCPECNQEYNDKFIQDAQINADIYYKVIEWIPYDLFQDIKQIAKGGYGTIYYAIVVVLKKFDGIVDITINDDFLNEMTIYLRTSGNKITSTILYGITKDPETHEYMMVLEYFKGGSLRNYLNNNFNNINWYNKLDYLKDLAEGFMLLFKKKLMHQKRNFCIYLIFYN